MTEELKQEEKQQEDETQKAREVLERKFQENKQKCWQELVEVLNKYQMSFDVSTVIRGDGKITHHLDLVPGR